MDGINEPLYPGHIPQATYDAQQQEMIKRGTPDESAKISAPSSGSAAGHKRKRMGAQEKFYAVKEGHRPGVYTSWPDCQREVKGYARAIYKSFPSREEADHFLKTGLNLGAAGPSKFYAVRGGRKPGVYTDWSTAQAQVYGWTKVKHKSFSTRAEAEAFVRGDEVADGVAEDGAKKKKIRKSNAHDGLEAGTIDENVEPGAGPMPTLDQDGFDSNIKLNNETGALEYRTPYERNKMKMQATGLAKDAVLVIYTDGSSRGNGKSGARGGVGVYFGPNDQRNVSEELYGPRQTNQRAELTAIQRALEIAPRNQDVLIRSDSKYSIKCVTEWFINWRKNNWLNATKKPVENRDLIELILNKIDERKLAKANTTFEWLKGHANDPGNVAADALAVAGASA